MYLSMSYKASGIIFSVLLLITVSIDVRAAQDMEHFKRCTVKIRNSSGAVGSGFIVAIDVRQKVAYIVTASHVVGDDEHPQITFFGRPDREIPASKVFIDHIQKEGTDRGLAFLWVTDKVPDGIAKLPLDLTGPPKGGDKVVIIGMPSGRPEWSIIEGSIEGQEGLDIYLSGNIRQGVSGAPMIKNGAVVGMITASGNNAIGIPAYIIYVFLSGVPGVPYRGSK
jgi:S1-C subfamily serine protease